MQDKISGKEISDEAQKLLDDFWQNTGIREATKKTYNSILRCFFSRRNGTLLTDYYERPPSNRRRRGQGGKILRIVNMQDKIGHPDHYTWLKEVAGIEVIDIARHMNFNLGNVIKYTFRAGHKHEDGMSDNDKRIEDLKKARWHLDDEIGRLGGADIPAPSDPKEDDEAPRPHTDDEEGVHNGHEYADLGLSVLWATCNVGAARPEGYGDYFAWGETKTKESYDIGNCEALDKQIDDIGGTDCDVEHVRWGGKWRLPTEDEFRELLDNCTWAWTERGGHAGYKVAGMNGGSIFLPATGWRDETSLNNTGSYWGSTPYESDTQHACNLYFNSGNCDITWYTRNYGQPVRPVVRL